MRRERDAALVHRAQHRDRRRIRHRDVVDHGAARRRRERVERDRPQHVVGNDDEPGDAGEGRTRGAEQRVVERAGIDLKIEGARGQLRAEGVDAGLQRLARRLHLKGGDRGYALRRPRQDEEVRRRVGDDIFQDGGLGYRRAARGPR